MKAVTIRTYTDHEVRALMDGEHILSYYNMPRWTEKNIQIDGAWYQLRAVDRRHIGEEVQRDLLALQPNGGSFTNKVANYYKVAPAQIGKATKGIQTALAKFMVKAA